MNKKKCIFLDRDGTINVYKELLHKQEDIELEKNAAEAIKMINDSDFICIVISNQPVVARNLCSLEEAWNINRKLEELLYKENGSYLDDIFICPHHPDKGYPEENKEYKIDCDCRKPKIGMILEAAKKHNIDLSKSYMVGDTTIDIMTGKNAGLQTILVKTGLAGQDKIFNVNANFVKDDLLKAIKKLLEDDFNAKLKCRNME
ncbi:MAG: HAD family hydrolase [Clostridiales bacterium]|nr:HAD family hydrolase [Clostridiales bacterium]